MTTTEITFNCESVGYVSVEHLLLVPDDDDQGFTNCLTNINTDHIKEMIQNKDVEYGGVNRVEFQIKDGCLIYQAKDDTGKKNKK